MLLLRTATGQGYHSNRLDKIRCPAFTAVFRLLALSPAALSVRLPAATPADGQPYHPSCFPCISSRSTCSEVVRWLRAWDFDRLTQAFIQASIEPLESHPSNTFFYLQSFGQNEVDGKTLLHHLSKEDLRTELGIPSLLDRKQLWEVIEQVQLHQPSASDHFMFPVTWHSTPHAGPQPSAVADDVPGPPPVPFSPDSAVHTAIPSHTPPPPLHTMIVRHASSAPGQGGADVVDSAEASTQQNAAVAHRLAAGSLLSQDSTQLEKRDAVTGRPVSASGERTRIDGKPSMSPKPRPSPTNYQTMLYQQQ
eukprot:gene2199-3101_t